MSADLPGGTRPPEETGILADAGILHDAGLGNGSGPVEPGLHVLLGLLNSGPTPDELAGENTALEMFRARRHQADFRIVEPRVTPPTVLREQVRRSRWLAAAGTVMAAAAITTAAYTQALPAPLQNVAYHVLGFVGVPEAHRVPKAPGPLHPARPARAHGSSPAAGARSGPVVPAAHPPPRQASVKPTVISAPASLSIAVARNPIVAGHGEVLIARLTSGGNPVPGARLYLLERATDEPAWLDEGPGTTGPTGEPAWQVAGSGTTGPEGRVFVTVSGLTTNTAFRFRGPHGALSPPVRVVVVPRLSVTVVKDPSKLSETLTANSQGAAPGDVVILQVRIDGRWLTVQVRELFINGRVKFVVKILGERRAYRVVLPRTRAHGRAVSKSVTISPGRSTRRG